MKMEVKEREECICHEIERELHKRLEGLYGDKRRSAFCRIWCDELQDRIPHECGCSEKVEKMPYACVCPCCGRSICEVCV